MPRSGNQRERGRSGPKSGQGRAQGNQQRPSGKSGRAGTQASAANGRHPHPSSSGRGQARSRASGASLRDEPLRVSPADWRVILSSARRKGEWWELRLPDAIAATASPAALAQRLPLPRKLVGKLLAEHGAVKAGRLFKLRLFAPEPLGMPAEWMEMNVLYEDDFVLAVNKPAGMEVHPSVHGQRGTLANAVAAYYEATGQACRVRPVHRIDKDTTGPVLFAKNEAALASLDQAMKEGRIDRRYTALAEGRIRDDRGTIDQPIGQDRHHSTRRRVSETGDRAVTRYQVLERFAEYTLVRLELETGRTHQIRVHLSSIGHPLAGDGMYGGHRHIIPRQALHGEHLTWPHPWMGNHCEVRAPLPDDMAAALRELRGR